jgi:hypothetical protein
LVSNPTNLTFDPLWYPPQATPRIFGAVKVTVVCACANPATIKPIAKINFRIVLLLSLLLLSASQVDSAASTASLSIQQATALNAAGSVKLVCLACILCAWQPIKSKIKQWG